MRSISIACWTTKATNTHSEIIILITFQQQQRLGERASVLRYTYSASVVCLNCLSGFSKLLLLFV